MARKTKMNADAAMELVDDLYDRAEEIMEAARVIREADNDAGQDWVGSMRNAATVNAALASVMSALAMQVSQRQRLDEIRAKIGKD